MRCSNGRMEIMLKNVRTTVKRRASRMPFATLRFTPLVSFAPNRCDVRTVKPAVMPCANPSTRNIIVPVEPTAASASAPTYRPTIIVSAML